MSTGRRVGLLIAVLLLTALALLVMVLQRGTAPDTAGLAVASDTADAGPEFSVRTVMLEESDVTAAGAVLRATGTLEANQRSVLSFVVSGVVQTLAADEGQTLRRGDLLAALDPVPYRSALDQALAQERYLAASLERIRLLYEAENVPREQLDQARSGLQTAQAAANLARWNLEQTQLRAPFNGRVSARHIEKGQAASPAVPAFEFLAVDTLKVRVGIPAKDLPRISRDVEVRVSLTDHRERALPGRVDHIPVSSDPRSGTVPVVVKTADPDRLFLPGLLVECEFRNRAPGSPSGNGSGGASAATEGFQAPLAALRVTGDGPVVLRVRDGMVEEVPVGTGAVRGDRVAVSGPLKAGDRIVVDPPDRLRDGDRVAVLEDRN